MFVCLSSEREGQPAGTTRTTNTTPCLFVCLQHARVNLPYNTYLHDSRVTLYGGVLQGVHTLNVSLDGVFTIYPPARLNTSSSSSSSSPSSSKELRLNSIVVLDGGRLEFTGSTEDADAMTIVLDGGLVVQGGGVLSANDLHVRGQSSGVVVSLKALECYRGRSFIYLILFLSQGLFFLPFFFLPGFKIQDFLWIPLQCLTPSQSRRIISGRLLP